METFSLPLTAMRKSTIVKLKGSPFEPAPVDGLSVRKYSIVVPAISIKNLHDTLLELNEAQAASLLLTGTYADAWEIYEEKQDVIEMSYATTSNYLPPSPQGMVYKSFQRAGIEYSAYNTGVFIADEPGLGKTIQAIGVCNVRQHKKIIVICPVAVKIHWKSCFEEWLVHSVPHITIVNSKTEPTFFKNDGVYILNYDIAVKLGPFIRKVDIVIFDESHYIRNYKAQRTKACAKIASTAKQVILLTGTPIENKPKDLYHQLRIIAPEVFNNSTNFYHKYCGPEFDIARKEFTFKGASNTEKLSELLRSTVLVRRLKKDVLKDLPSKNRIKIILSKGKVNGNCKSLLSMLGNEDIDTAIANMQIKSGSLFSSIRVEEALEKTPHSITFIEDLLEGVSKVVVFYHHKKVGDMICSAFGDSCVRLEGENTQEERNTAKEKFIKDSRIKIIAISIMAGGTGLDGLQEVCSTAVFCELPYNSSTLTQAEDRLHRIGQEGSVTIYHMLMQDTLDFAIAKGLIDKQANADKILN